ncbi:hypothetical protein KC19_3G069400 [Ceratodon purpureus]|uniref:RING-type domain-containing protein n=1 Tax=Ceratodon purpureus TaxID=3225 RepID=A0A8T0II10_CERPU|nr:hypothetical protein KC19_3G069400 [Ceratodon purpureus]
MGSIRSSSSYDPLPCGDTCNICFNVVEEDHVITKCNHLYCTSCIEEWLIKEYALHKKATCPTCHKSLYGFYDYIITKRMFPLNVHIVSKFIIALLICTGMIYLLSFSRLLNEYHIIQLLMILTFIIVYWIECTCFITGRMDDIVSYWLSPYGVRQPRMTPPEMTRQRRMTWRGRRRFLL